MKVTSMACIQGAWAPDINPERILDIGAGTGVLSLMCAQRFGVPVDAIEIDEESFGQLAENIAQSPWSQLIRPIHADIRVFAIESKPIYDYIIINPPFYKGQLKSPSARRNRARHDTTLSLNDLVNLLPGLINENGIVSMLLPEEETEIIRPAFANNGLLAIEELKIAEQETHPIKAIVTLFSKRPSGLISNSLYIKDETGEYAKCYCELLKPYYLHM